MRKWATKLVASVVFLLSLFGLFLPAMAIDALPDAESPRSLTIIKYSGAEDSQYTTEYRPLENIIFDIYRYADLDADVPASITEEAAKSWTEAYPDSLITSVITDSKGCGTWNAAERGKEMDGVYLVVERDHRAIEARGKAVPFLISLPYTDDGGRSWLYAVTVEPKNTVAAGPTVEKDVMELNRDHGSAAMGQTFSWIIRGEVPDDLYTAVTVNGEIKEQYAKQYVLTDRFDTRLTYIGNLRFEIQASGSTIAQLPESDFDLSGTAAAGKPGGDLVISLNRTGMKDVMVHASGREDAEIVIYVDSAINDTAAAGVDIPNDVTLDYTNSVGYAYDPETVPEPNIPEVHLGGIRIEKVDAEDSSQKLEGAEFHLARSEEEAKNGTWLKDEKGNEIILTTDASGRANYIGLAYGSEAKEPFGGTYYYLVETKAPSGYELDSTPARVTVNATTYAEANAYQIKNQPMPAAGLTGIPRTGNIHWPRVLLLALIAALGGAIGMGIYLLKKRLAR